MLVRIVKLSFNPAQVEEFLEIFEATKNKIRATQGCLQLELYRDKDHQHQFFTYSYWENENSLENYRKSMFFKEIWGKTKLLFNAKPEAWSTEKLWVSDKK